MSSSRKNNLPYLSALRQRPLVLLAAGLIGYLALSLVALLMPDQYVLKLPLLVMVYVAAATFAVGAMSAASSHARRRSQVSEGRFWTTLSVGVVLRVSGDLGWIASTRLDLPTLGTVAYQEAWLASYVLMFAALAMFIARVNRRLALIAVLDSAAVFMTVGIMAYYFVVAPVLSDPGEGPVSAIWVGLPSLVPELLRRPVADITLFFLTLVVLSAKYKPRSAGLLSVAFLSFCVADALLWRVSATPSAYVVDNMLGMFWALGLLLIGIAALSSQVPGPHVAAPASSALAPRPEEGEDARRLTLQSILAGDAVSEPWRAILFWLGPLSPAMLYGFLIVWNIARGDMPVYVSVGTVLLLVYLAARIAIILYVNRILIAEREDEAKRVERGRIAGELDDALQKSVHAIPSLLESYRHTQPTDPQRAEEIFEQTEQEAREASYRVSYPVRELRALSGETAIGPQLLVEQLLTEIETNFSITIHRRLHASPEDLTDYELASAYRIVSEALFNAAKHSGAKNIWVTSRYVGSVFLAKVFDDGQGFDTATAKQGLGIPLMHSRAAGMGAALDLISNPGMGTTVQIRFDAGQRKRHELAPRSG